jgi:Mg2+ and Co2+ transporter CorA
MTMLFLPASLVSSFFGMGFFSTDQDPSGHKLFIVSQNWWWWLAVSVPTTLVCFIVVAYTTHWSKKKSDAEAEKGIGRKGSILP